MLALCLLIGALCVVAILKARSMQEEEPEYVEPEYVEAFQWPDRSWAHSRTGER